MPIDRKDETMHSRSTLRGSTIILLGFALAAGSAGAQPVGVSFWTLEAKMVQADAVVRGTIAKLTPLQIVPPGGRDQQGILQPEGIFHYSIAIKVDEFLKGDIKGDLVDLRPIEAFYHGKTYQAWMDAKTSFLWFLGPEPKDGTKRAWELLRLGRPVPAERSSAPGLRPPMFSMNFKVLKDSKDILDRAQIYAGRSAQPVATHVIRIPPEVALQTGSAGSWNNLIIPVDPSLEQTARRLIDAPQDFVPKYVKLDAAGRNELRYGGVTSLAYFKSDTNAALLRTLIDEPAVEPKTSFGGRNNIGTKAYGILLAWDVDTPAPKSVGEITTLDLSGTPISDAGMKRLAPLKNLTTLHLDDTKVNGSGLKELAGLRKLTSLRLNESHISDGVLRSLREIHLLHTLCGASAKGHNRRPGSADDVITLNLLRSSVSDAGLKELSGLASLQSLYLGESRVTGSGFDELAGLKNLTEVHLRKCPVTDVSLRGLVNLKNVVWLDLGHTQVTDAGLKELAGFKNLKILELDGTKVTGVNLKGLGLNNLVALYLNPSSVTDATLRSLRELDMLHTLSLSTDVTVRIPRPSNSDAALTEFGLGGTSVTDAGLKELADLKNLKHVGLGGTKITGTGFKHLGSLTNLTELSAHGNAFTEEGLRELAELKGLRTLHMSAKDITDERLRALCQTGMVHVLYEASSRTDYPPATFPPRAKSDDAVRSLDLGGWRSTEATVVTDASLKEIARLKNLAKLDLTHAYVSGVGLKDLAPLEQLRELSLGGPQVADETLKDLPRLARLTTLGLHDTSMTGAGARQVAGLKNLTRLKLTGKAVTDAWLKELAGLENLAYLRLYWTNVTDAGIAEFRSARPKCAIER